MISLFFYIVLTALLGSLAVWVISQLAPNRPIIIDRIVWVIVVLLIVLSVMTAFGIVGPALPRFPLH